MSLHPEAQEEKSLFPLGRLMITTPALSVLSQEDIRVALGRHMRGDWGEVDVDDWRANELSINDCARILSAYRSAKDLKFWIITEADRSQTTVLLPEDY